jgi:hypothetical protein
MGRAPEFATALLAAALVLLLPSLVAADTPAAVGLAVMAMALVAIVRFGAAFGALSARTSTAAYATRREAPPLLPGRATDPVHHPLCPRAPGTA